MSRYSIALQTSLRPASIALTSAVAAAAARHYDTNAGAPFRTALLHRTFAMHGRRRQGLSVAIVGSGPSGCYTAKYLQTGAEKKGLDVANMDVFDRLPTPYGTFSRPRGQPNISSRWRLEATARRPSLHNLAFCLCLHIFVLSFRPRSLRRRTRSPRSQERPKRLRLVV